MFVTMLQKKCSNLFLHRNTVNRFPARPKYIENFVTFVTAIVILSIYREKSLLQSFWNFCKIFFTGCLNGSFQQKVRRLTAFPDFR